MLTTPVFTKEIDIMAKYLTDTEQEILDVINNLYEGNGVLPSNKEILSKLISNRKEKGLEDYSLGRSFLSQYLSRLHEKKHIVYENGSVTKINISDALSIDYVFKKLEWLTAQKERGNITEREYQKYKNLLNSRIDGKLVD